VTGPLNRIAARAGDAIVAALLVASVVEVSFAASESRWLTIPLAVGWSAPLFARRRTGLGAGLAVIAVFLVANAVFSAVDDTITAALAVLAAFLVMGLHEDRSRAVLGGVVGFVVLIAVFAADSDGLRTGDVFASAIFAFGPLVAGLAVRERTERAIELAERTRRLEQAREEEARLAVTEERARIARELHDVIAQSIGAMTVQAGAARTWLREDPAQARTAIEAVEETGRDALAETRRLLGILRRDMATPALSPQPGLAALDRLVDAARSDGLSIELSVDGSPRELPPGPDLAAYRIVQDGLARARGREGATHVAVRLRWRRDALEIEIDDDGGVVGAEGDDAVELAAMRERLALYHGTVEARRRSDGVSSVRARLPLEAAVGVGSTEPPRSGGAGFAGAGAGES
jgi:signal transduction histidine kinase